MTCVICNSDQNLNTTLSIVVDGETVQVKLCDTHAEECTPKDVRLAYLDRQKQINELLETARKLGVELVPKNQVQKITQKAEPELRPAQPKQQTKGHQTDFVPVKGPSVVKDKNYNIIPQGPVPNEDNSPIDLNSIGIPEEAFEGVAKIDRLEARSGQIIEIPTVRKDSLGETRIIIQKSGGDSELQNSFRQSSDRSINGGIVDTYSDGYKVKTCGFCNGRLMVENKGKLIVCPKCNGRG